MLIDLCDINVSILMGSTEQHKIPTTKAISDDSWYNKCGKQPNQHKNLALRSAKNICINENHFIYQCLKCSKIPNGVRARSSKMIPWDMVEDKYAKCFKHHRLADWQNYKNGDWYFDH